MLQVLGSEVKVHGHGGPNMLEEFLTLLMRYLENSGTEFHQTFSIDAFWDKNEQFRFCGQKTESQRHSMHVQGPSGQRHTSASSLISSYLHYLRMKIATFMSV